MMRQVFFVSDRTGITAETLGRSLLTQFPDTEFRLTHIPFVTNQLAAEKAAATIRGALERDGVAPLVFSTLTDPATQYIVSSCNDYVFDLFGTFIEPLEDALGMESSHTAGRMHGIGNAGEYEQRLNALNFTLSHDDGLHTRDIDGSDLILVGVSRCGKTPTCLYLAMHYSLSAANYPLTDDDFEPPRLPDVLASAAEAVRAHDRAGAACAHPARTPAERQILGARAVPCGSRAGGSFVQDGKHSVSRHDDDFDRGDRGDDRP